jgi:DNA-binding response OmpR family regulator
MGVGISQLNAPILLYLEEEHNTTFFFADEFKKLAPHWEIVRVHDRLSAMRHLADKPEPHAVVIDLTLLDEEGMELIKWVKGQPRFRFLPIIVLSNSNDSSRRQRCVALGVTSYLDKPESLGELRNNIHYIAKLCEGARFDAQEWKEMSCV